MPLWAGKVKRKIHAMFKRLFSSSFSAVLRHPVDSGIQVCLALARQSKARPAQGLGDSTASSLPPRLGALPGRESFVPVDGGEPLALAQRDFIEALSDIRTQQAGDLVRRIRLARSLRELWFLRSEVFNLVAHHRDQGEANHRMAALGAYFPRQATRSPAGRLRATRV